MLPKNALLLAEKIVTLYTRKKRVLALAESCTGGLIAAAITSVPGSSAVLDRGYVTYSNRAKSELLGVPPALIKKHGAVSTEVAAALAENAQKKAKVDVALSITGIAGPGGGTKIKPVGLVFIAMSDGKKTIAKKFNFKGSRENIRSDATLAALNWLLKL